MHSMHTKKGNTTKSCGDLVRSCQENVGGYITGLGHLVTAFDVTLITYGAVISAALSYLQMSA